MTLRDFKTIPSVAIPEDGIVRSSDAFMAASGQLLKRVQIALPCGRMDAVVPLKDWEEQEERSRLPEITEPQLLEQSLPKIPWDDPDGGVVQCWNYFALVYDKQNSEAFVWWHWDAEMGKYLMVVPAYYYATGGSLDYPTHSGKFCRSCRVALHQGAAHCPHCVGDEDIQKLMVLGTSHSHGRMSPFHSGTDHANELDVTGFHITFGELQRGPVIEGSFVMADGHTRFKTDWSDHFALTMSELDWQRLSLWLTLVSNYSTMSRDKWTVVDAKDRIIFAHSDKTQCETWAKFSGHTDDLVIKKGERQTIERPVQGRVLTLTQGRTGESKARSRRRAPARRKKTRKSPDIQFSGSAADAITKLLAEVPEALRGLLYRTVLDDVFAEYNLEEVAEYADADLTSDLLAFDETFTGYADSIVVGKGKVSWCQKMRSAIAKFRKDTGREIEAESFEWLATLVFEALANSGLAYAYDDWVQAATTTVADWQNFTSGARK